MTHNMSLHYIHIFHITQILKLRHLFLVTSVCVFWGEGCVWPILSCAWVSILVILGYRGIIHVVPAMKLGLSAYKAIIPLIHLAHDWIWIPKLLYSYLWCSFHSSILIYFQTFDWFWVVLCCTQRSLLAMIMCHMRF